MSDKILNRELFGGSHEDSSLEDLARQLSSELKDPVKTQQDKSLYEKLDLHLIPENTMKEFDNDSTIVNASTLAKFRNNEIKPMLKNEVKNNEALALQIVTGFRNKVDTLTNIQELEQNYQWTAKFLNDLFENSTITLQTLNNSLKICKEKEIDAIKIIKAKERSAKLRQIATLDALQTYENIQDTGKYDKLIRESMKLKALESKSNDN